MKPRPRRMHGTLRAAPHILSLESMSDEDLTIIATRGIGIVTTSDSPVPWRGSPRYCAEAGRILRIREGHEEPGPSPWSNVP